MECSGMECRGYSTPPTRSENRDGVQRVRELRNPKTDHQWLWRCRLARGLFLLYRAHWDQYGILGRAAVVHGMPRQLSRRAARACVDLGEKGEGLHSEGAFPRH